MRTMIENSPGSRDLLDSIQGASPVPPLANGGEAFAQSLRDGGGQAFSCFSCQLASEVIGLGALDAENHAGAILPYLEEWCKQSFGAKVPCEAGGLPARTRRGWIACEQRAKTVGTEGCKSTLQ
jgi:hypothetical protein